MPNITFNDLLMNSAEHNCQLPDEIRFILGMQMQNNKK